MIRHANALWAGVILLIAAASAVGETFTVINTHDNPDAVYGSLRWAVEQANSVEGPDTIVFAIPETDTGYDPGTGVWTINSYYVGYSLSVDDGTYIDGFSQREFIGGDPNPLGPEIELSGGCIGIRRTSDITVRGLCINEGHFTPISISGRPGEIIRNISVTGCYLNTDAAGIECVTPERNGISCSRVTGLRIGGDSEDERNIVSCANNYYVSLSYCGDAEIVNNYFGTDRTGTQDLVCEARIGVSISYTTGPVLFRDNVVGAYWPLVHIAFTECDSGPVTMISNHLGETLDGTPMGSLEGIEVWHSPGHLFRENIIAHCHSRGAMNLHGDITDYVTITRNAIYDSRGGIDLYNSDIQNFHGIDPADGVYGPGVNEEIDTPLCESMITDSESTTVYFRCMRDCVVEIFIADPGVRSVCSEAGYDYVYSGMTYLGDAEEIVQGPVWSTYRYTIAPGLVPGTRITCTATNGNGSTSEFGCTCQVPVEGDVSPGCVPEGHTFDVSGLNRGGDEVLLRYALPEPARLAITVYDMGGREVAVAVQGDHDAGEYTIRWKPRPAGVGDMPSGSYLFRLTADRFISTREVVIIR